MNKISSAIRLLGLFSIFFIYKTIMGVIENNPNEVFLWFLITIIYIISIVILYFVSRRWEGHQNL
ncbi:MAG: hypothetical protein ACFE9S_08935 [Candidatus Hermodarchaeota archaeon]